MNAETNKLQLGRGRKSLKHKKEFDEGRFFFSQPYQRFRYLTEKFCPAEPNPPPLNSNTHLFLNTFAVRRDSMLADAYSLLADFLQRDSVDFSAFKEVWLKKQFHLTHFVCPSRNLRNRFMFAQYQTFFTFLYEEAAAKFPGNDNQLKLKLGVLFSLYMLYLTQPKFVDPCLISVDTNQWNILNKMHQYFAMTGITDGVYVFGKLKEVKAFCFVVYIEHRPFYYQQSRLGFDGFLPEMAYKPQHQKTTEKKSSRISILEDRLKVLENAVSSTRLGDLVYSDLLKELQELEARYEKSREELVVSEVALGLNEPISSTLMVPGFQQWLATRGEDEQLVTASSYFEHLVSSHLSLKAAHLNSIPPHEPFENVGDTHQRSAADPAMSEPSEINELESSFQAQADVAFSKTSDFENNNHFDHVSESKNPDEVATSPKSIASLTYSFASE